MNHSINTKTMACDNCGHGVTTIGAFKLACYGKEHVDAMNVALAFNPHMRKADLVERMRVKFGLTSDAAWILVSRYWNERNK